MRPQVKIAKVLGTDGLFAYLDKYGITLDPQFVAMIGTYAPQRLRRTLDADALHL